MLQQKEILQWLCQFNISQIKQFLTIKNPNHIEYLHRLLTYKPEDKPKERMQHGYSQNKINDQSTLYQRDKFRYKKKKQEKKKMDDIFFENITVTRNCPWALSVRKSFIQSGQLSECMLLFSDGQVFNYLHERQSIWFKTTNISSFSEWIIHFFEIEILDAYRNHESVQSINHFIYADLMITLPLIKQTLIQIIHSFCEKNNNKNIKKMKNSEVIANEELMQPLQISKQESSYLLQKCLQKFQGSDRDIGQIIFEYEWFTGDRTNKINRVLEQLSRLYEINFQSYLIDLKAKQIDQLTQVTIKKKRKKAKKEKQITQQEQEKIEKNIQQFVIQEKIQQIKTVEQIQLRSQEKLTTNKISQANIKKQEKKKKSKGKAIKQAQQSQPAQHTVLQQQTERKINHLQKDKQRKNAQYARSKQQIKKQKKAVTDRINQNIFSYYQQLEQSSNSLQKYRKICIQLINSTVEQIMIKMKIKMKWSLVLFGSCCVNFSLKTSDLDFFLQTQQVVPQFIFQLFHHFKARQWLTNCSIIDTKITILKFDIILSQIKHNKLKENKKKINNIINVQISSTHHSENHYGMRNTQNLRQILDSNQDVRIICLILKELLRIHQLNKPYKGGIGSYVLVMMVYNILKNKEYESNGNYLKELLTFTGYMNEQFQAHKTLITSVKHSKLIINSQFTINVQDPKDNVLITTNANDISDALGLFKQLTLLLSVLQKQMMQINAQERKKMKRVFFQHWNVLFKPEIQSTY